MSSCPTPGQANTVSVTIAPAIISANSSTENVTTGRSAFLSACFQITIHSGSPLMRASLTYSLSSTSSMAERVSRMMGGVVAHPMATAGRTRLPRCPRPAAGRSPSQTAKTSISMRPSQNRGMDCPSTARSRPPSRRRCRG